MCQAVFIAIPKKRNAIECELHRTISLLSHVTKIILRVLMMRARRKIRDQIADEQYGFMKDKGRRNAIFNLRILGERAIEMQKDLYVCFIDYQKAFDNVKHETLFELLERIDLDGKDRRLLQNLYWKQSAAIRIDGKLSKWVKIKKGTRQGCVFSPDLYNLYSEYIMRKIEGLDGRKVGGVNINNIRYADDTILIADDVEKLQRLLDEVVEESERFGLKINEKKTFCMVMTKIKEPPLFKLHIKGKVVQQVDKFSFLGSLITSDGKSEQEIKKRIAMAKTSFQRMKSILTSRSINIGTRTRILKCYIWSTMLYGCETWTISKVMERRLEAAEMWFIRRMLRIPWTAKMKNEEVLSRAGTERRMIETIKKRQLGFFGHIIRKGTLESIITAGKIEGKRARGWQRDEYLGNLGRNLGKKWTPIELIKMASDRTRWNIMIAHVDIDTAP